MRAFRGWLGRRLVRWGIKLLERGPFRRRLAVAYAIESMPVDEEVEACVDQMLNRTNVRRLPIPRQSQRESGA